MSLEVKIHNAQLEILRELLFHPSANYAALQKPTGLTSDHFNFHIARLIELNLVERIERGVYRLTLSGKEYANKLDTDNSTVERQPKMAVLLILKQSIEGAEKYLIQERIKNPNYGFHGFPTGKVRWGETIIQTAQRELAEETGLTADFEVAGVYHEHVTLDDTSELIEDKVFFVCRGTNVGGVLKSEFEGGRNQWLRFEEFMSKEKRFNSVSAEMELYTTDTWMIERTETYISSTF